MATDSSTTLRGPSVDAGSLLPSAWRRTGALAVLTLLAIAGFLTVGVEGNWAFVLERRAATVATMVVVATAIAISTVVFHTLTTNQILTPGIMGFDSLYLLVQTVAVLAWGVMWTTDLGALPRFALETGIMLAFALPLMRWLFVGRRRSLQLVVLVGLVAGGVFRSTSSFLQRIMDPTQFVVLQDRFFADFNSADPVLLAACSVIVAGAAALLWHQRNLLDVLALGRDVSTALGVDHRRVTMQALTIVTLLVCVSTALVGPTTFFGLLVAHLAYRIVRTHRHVVTLPAAAVCGILCLVAGQLVFEQVLGFAGSLSIIVEFLGGITFIAMFLRRARS